MADQQEPQPLQIHVDKDVARGVYSNIAQIKHSKEEFCIDFFHTFQPMAGMVARVIISPGHLKRMISALKDNLDKYERKFGPVQEADEPTLFKSDQKKS